MTKTCTDCPANRIQNNMPYGFCPLGYQQKRAEHKLIPAGDCPAPKSHAELLAVLEEESE